MELKDLIPIESIIIEIDDDIDDTHYLYEKHGTLSSKCPHCGNVNNITVDYMLENFSCDEHVTAAFRIQCKACHNNYVDTDPLDPNIVNAIEMLNSLGYETAYSCEGHAYDLDNNCYFANPYIVFKSDKIKSYPPPEGWVFVDEYDIIGQPVGTTWVNLIYRFTDNEIFDNNDWKVKALTALYDWINSIVDDRNK